MVIEVSSANNTLVFNSLCLIRPPPETRNPIAEVI
jgi:hypothetical protein